MLSALDAAVSGILASTTLINTSAHNVANISTEGFKKDEVHLSSRASGGVDARVEKSTEPGLALYSSDGTLITGSNVNLAEEVVNQILAKTMLKASAQVIKTVDKMQGSLLDIII